MYHTMSSSAIAVPVKKANINNAHANVFSKFYQWTVGQEENRFMWLAFTYILQIGLALPCTLLAVVFFGGNNFNLWLLACVVNVPSLAINLAAQPTKVTLPVLFFAWLVDAAIILYAALHFFIQ